MKKILPLLVALLGYSLFVDGQCSVNKTDTGNDLCSSSSCTAITQNGILQGNITFNSKSGNGNGKTEYELQRSCAETQLAIGAATFVIPKNVTLTIPDDYPFAPSALAGTGVRVVIVEQGSGGLIIGGELFDQFSSANAALRAAAAQALPITLLSWKAAPVPAGIQLDWASANETDNDFYLIEHSTDGNNFEELTRVAGQTSSEVELTYTYKHVAPGAGTHYYRLSQQDLDGTRTSFDVLAVNYGEASSDAKVFPNPALPGDELKLGAGLTGPVGLYHIDGRRVADYPLPDGAPRQITLPTDLPTGVYLIRQGTATSRLLVR